MRSCSWRAAVHRAKCARHDDRVVRWARRGQPDCWPSGRFDVGAINNVFSRPIPRVSTTSVHVAVRAKRGLGYEHRSAAACMGRGAAEPEPDVYEHRTRTATCRSSAVAWPARGARRHQVGARVILCDETPRWEATCATLPRDRWPARAGMDRGHRACACGQCRRHAADAHDAFGYHDDNLVGAVERITDGVPAADMPRQGLEVRAKAVVSLPARWSVRSLLPATMCRDGWRERRRPMWSATGCGRASAPSCSPTTMARTPMRSHYMPVALLSGHRRCARCRGTRGAWPDVRARRGCPSTRGGHCRDARPVARQRRR